MKLIGFLLLALGFIALGLCLATRSQFGKLTTNGQATSAAEYPLVEMLIPNPSPSSTPADPSILAKTISIRIYAVGAAGILGIVAGLGLLLLSMRNSSETQATAENSFKLKQRF